MHKIRRIARLILHGATLTDFNALVTEAKISDEDAEVLVLRFVKGWSIVQIAEHLHCSVEKINKSICKSYEKVYNVLTD